MNPWDMNTYCSSPLQPAPARGPVCSRPWPEPFRFLLRVLSPAAARSVRCSGRSRGLRADLIAAMLFTDVSQRRQQATDVAMLLKARAVFVTDYRAVASDGLQQPLERVLLLHARHSVQRRRVHAAAVPARAVAARVSLTRWPVVAGAMPTVSQLETWYQSRVDLALSTVEGSIITLLRVLVSHVTCGRPGSVVAHSRNSWTLLHH